MHLVRLLIASLPIVLPTAVHCEETGRTGERPIAATGVDAAAFAVPVNEVRMAQSSGAQSRGVRVAPREEFEPQPPVSMPPANIASEALPPIVGSRQLFESTVWEIVQQSNDPADFRAYLKMFPKGRFAAHARDALGMVPPASDNPEASPIKKRREPTGTDPDPKTVETNLRLPRADRLAIQRSLNALNHAAGAEDGVFGTRTREAVRRYQAALDFETTGYLTRDQAAVLIELGRSIAPSQPANASTSAAPAPAAYNDTSGTRTKEHGFARPAVPSARRGETPNAVGQSSKKNEIAPATLPEGSTIRFLQDRKAIEKAIIDFIIDVGSSNCWGDIYFCYLDEIKDTKFSNIINNSIIVVSEYTLISSYSLTSSADKRKFVSEFVLLKFAGNYQVVSVRTVRFARNSSEAQPPTESTE